jgi:hypothetical protein
MNLIDAHVTLVLSKKQRISPLDGTVYDVFTVEYWDDGRERRIKDLWFQADEHMDIQPGYVFRH